MEVLYNEYEKSLQIQKNIIKSNTEKLKKAREVCNYKEVRRLKSLLKMLYEEKWELEEKTHQLKKYLGTIKQ